MARSSLVCSIWQRYDFIPNIRCYQPEKSADPAFGLCLAGGQLVRCRPVACRLVGMEEAHGLSEFEIVFYVVVGSAIHLDSQLVERVVVAPADPHGMPCVASADASRESHGLHLPFEVLLLLVVFGLQQRFLAQQTHYRALYCLVVLHLVVFSLSGMGHCLTECKNKGNELS